MGPKILNICRTESYRTKNWGRILPGIYWCHQEQSSYVVRRLATSRGVALKIWDKHPDILTHRGGRIQSCSATKNRKDLERVKKAAIKVILGSNYTTYKEGLKILKIQSLDDRRKTLCLKFAKKCLKNEKVKNMLPINEQKYRIETRKRNKFKIFKSNTNRYDKSAVPYMRRILNEDWQNNMRNMQT